MPRHAPALECSPEDKATLVAISKSRSEEARIVERARIILASLEEKEVEIYTGHTPRVANSKLLPAKIWPTATIMAASGPWQIFANNLSQPVQYPCREPSIVATAKSLESNPIWR